MAVESDLLVDPPHNPVSGVAAKAAPGTRLVQVQLAAEGGVITTDWQNAQDMIRFGSARRIVGEFGEPDAEGVITVDAAVPATEAAPEPQQGPLNVAEQAVAALEDLRAELTELGVDVDMRWGLKRLNTELAAARAAAGVEPGEDD
jgi:hypothetical protein